MSNVERQLFSHPTDNFWRISDMLVGARLLEEVHLGEAPQNAVSAPHIGLQCLQRLQQLTLDPCDWEELSDREVASAAGTALDRDCRLPLLDRRSLSQGDEQQRAR